MTPAIFHESHPETFEPAGGESLFHKMRNVLNGIQVSTGVIHQHLREFHLEDFRRVADMMEAHEPNVGWYLSQDPKGKKIPRFLGQLSQGLVQKHVMTMTELTTLQSKLEQLEYLLTVAQKPDRAGGFKDTVKFSMILEEATALHQPELDRLQIRVVRNYQPVSEGTLEVSKLLSILADLLRTAINAMRDLPDRAHCLTLHVLPCPDRERFVRMQVEDTGIGIPMERLTQVLAPSSTLAASKPRPPNLHICALTAKELGGALRVWSEGPGRGAMLTLDLPVIQMEGKRA